MPKSKGKNTDEGEGNVAEGLVDLGIDDEKDKKKFLEIINEEEKHVKESIIRSNLEIQVRECGKLALIYSQSVDVFNEVEKNLKQVQAKKATKFQQKKEKKAQIKFNTLKRQRNEMLARLYVISSHIGKHDKYFVDDPTGNTSAKEKDKAQKIEQAKWQLRFFCMKRNRGMHKSKPKKKSKGKERR